MTWLRVMFTALVLVASWPVNAPAADPRQLEILRQDLARQEAKLVAAAARERQLRAELARLESRLADQQQQLATLSQHLQQQQQLRQEHQRELAALKADRAQAGELVQQRLAAAYRLGEVGLLNILFSAESLAELLELHDNFQFIREHDRQIFAAYRQRLDELRDARTKAQRLTAELRAAQAATRRQEEQLQRTKAEQELLLRRVQNEKQLYRQASRQLAAAARQLDRPPATAADFSQQLGQLTWPVDGPVTTEFGQNITGRLGTLSASRGLTISAPPGAAVQAIAAGTVVHAGELEGYGQVIIIDHGQDYFSLLAGLATIKGRPGDKVDRGQVLGFMAATDQTGGHRLYLEIRRDVQPQDPRRWLAPR